MGNTRVVINRNKTASGNADIVYYADYYPLGMELRSGGIENRYGYQGLYAEKDKETGWNNFELRNYDAVIGRWLTTDPKGQYVSPYVGMGNNPVSGFDVDGGWSEGDDLEVRALGGSKFEVIGGTKNSDKNIYLMEDGKRVSVLGQMLTEFSFHGESGDAVRGATIDLNDWSGQNFFENEIRNIGVFEYISNAKGGEPLDFKTRGISAVLNGKGRDQYVYRGMPFQGKVASARDIGNYSAGYVAGTHGISWNSSRFAFDALQTKQEKGAWNTIMLYPFNRGREGQPTQEARKAGHGLSYPIFKKRQADKEWQKIINPWSIGSKL